jgi:hypothetical protein
VWDAVNDVIRAHVAHGPVDEAILNAAFLFEKWVAREVTSDPGEYQSRGWSQDVAAAPLDEDACARLRDSLVALVTEYPDDLHCASAYWALGKLGDGDLLPVFRAGLEYRVARDTDAVYQIMIALRNLGEPVFAGRGSSSYDDPDNVKLARDYLSLPRE